MIQLKPFPENTFVCPACGADNPLINQFRFESINVFADCICSKCGVGFYQALSVGHTVDYAISVNKKNGKVYHPEKYPSWLSLSVSKAFKEKRTAVVPIEKIIYKRYEKVIILNALDSLYGHVLLKMYNSLYHLDHDQDLGLIIIVPKSLKWLLPNGCAEVWIVDLKLGELIYNYDSIQHYVTEQLQDFKEVYLSKAYSHPQLGALGIRRLTGVTPFELSEFTKRKPVITFVLREDRWWFNSKIDFYFYLFCRKLKILPWAVHILSERQNQLIRRVMKLVKKEIYSVNFFIVGLGEIGSFEDKATDLRSREMSESIEMEWCKIYAKSHVVIGIHGSNMLLPTALAAGCVEILPEDRYGNMLQDISLRYNDRKQLFFYRFADQFARADSVASKAVAILRDYEIFNRNMLINVYPDVPSMTSLIPVDDFNH